MSGVFGVAAALRATTSSLPRAVIVRLDEELGAILAMLAELLRTSRHEHVVDEIHGLREHLCASLTAGISEVEALILAKADALADEHGPIPSATTTAPTPVEGSSGRKVDELRGMPPPRVSGKETNHYLQEITRRGWVAEKGGGGHVKVWGPHGEAHVFSSTPSTQGSVRRLRRLLEQIDHQRKDTSDDE
ncbi:MULTISPECIES: hypothetical protein [Actinoalloteichus]|uniref:Uncharacterized protein n=1 Tax=Actinoalloteichus fjordicus TaxID=1612552 RepID=A0AAC9LF68_9PSEU|nr:MULTISPECIES: hypothetical protein [Actinoalloteichus]APU15190.1 hypothetical protein UA74_15690 [Actinoalloteichus fjordicus]APU21259.1 hypothetical protein UA75_16255 [Actinoalloteichus sp. GBA129-24]